ncbi:MAG: FAD-binding oxidoreductase [Pseudomonadota bacterium]
MASETQASVLVIGAGIVGISTALRLQRHGLSVSVIDKQPPGEGTSYGNAGVLATSSIIPVTTPGLLKKVPSMLADRYGPLYLRWSYLPKMASWLKAYLANCREDRVRYIANHMAPITANSLEEHQLLARGTEAERRIQLMSYVFAYKKKSDYESDPLGWELRKANDIPWEVYEGRAARELEPALAPDYECLVQLPEQHGTIDGPGDYVKALARAFVAAGGRVEQADVVRLVANDGAISGVQLGDGTERTAGKIVVACGAWSARLLKTVGISVPLESERGYHIELRRASVRPNNAIMVADGKFVATPMTDRLRVAGLVEFGGLDNGPSDKPVQTLLHRIQRVFPGIEYEDYVSWMGHRPATTDSLPLIGESANVSGLFCAFGHQHVGLTGGPKTGRLVADLVVGARPNLDMAAYAVDRFS